MAGPGASNEGFMMGEMPPLGGKLAPLLNMPRTLRGTFEGFFEAAGCLVATRQLARCTLDQF